MSHAVFRQLTPPTGVEFCIHSHFTAEDDDNLIVAKTSCLEIYRLIQQVQTAKKKVLQLVSIYYTSGNIDSINTIKLQGSKTDSLILSFRDAKISIIEFDQSTNSVKLVSMHYYEKAPRSKLSPVQYSIEPFVRVDPDYRCAVALVYDVSLAIIPFRYQSEDLLDDFSEKYGDSNDKILPSFLIDLPSMGIVHVKDIIFLEEYFQPTLLILHEPKQTWSGRLAIHRNSCVLTAISLKLSSKQHPVIWSIEDLPYDSISLLSVPKPLGGAIVNCVNGIIYCNQSIKYQLLLNAFTPISTNTPYPIEISKFFITLDSARFCFLSPERILASLKGGELFFFELVSNGKTIEKIEISKGGSSVITTSMCLLSNNYIFLGSRLGDSILIHYENNLISPVENSDFPPNKFQRTSSEIETDDFQELNDIDEDFFYRTTSNTSTAKRTFNFTVKDSLLNTGPIVDLEIAESTDPASTSTSEIDSRKTNVEIVTCSGNGKGGSLSILQGGMRPQIITSFNLPGCKSIWTVFSDKQTKGAKRKQRDWEEETANETSTNVDHSLLILSTDKRTMVLDTAEGDLSEISNESNLSLSTDQRTLNVSNMMGTKRILQVTKFDVRFIANKHKLLQKITYPTPILDSIVLDQYAIIFLKDSIELLSLISNGNKLKQTQLKLNPKREYDEITACCLYKDTPGKHPLFPSSDNNNNNNQNYMLVSRISGAMEIYRIEGIDFILLFESSRFARGPSLVTHESDNINESSQKIGRRRISLSSSSNVITAQRFVVEILLLNFASELKSPFLIAITDTNDLLIYESFHYEGKLRFSRFAHNFFIRPLVLTPSNSQKSNDQNNNLNNSSNEISISSDENNTNNHHNDNDNDNDNNNNASNGNEDNNQKTNSTENEEDNKQNGESKEEIENEEKEKEVGYKTKRLFPFTHGNKSGIFLGGLRPAWLVCERDYLRIFPMNIDHNVHCYADFNNTKSCPNGFVYSSKNSALNISRIIPLMNYDFHWPLKKINLRLPGQFFTPHHVVYYKQTKSFIVSVSFRRPMVNPPLPIEEMGGIPKYEDVYEMRLYSPEQNWASIDMYPFEESEHILCVALAQLTVKDSDTGTSSLKPFVLVGTGYLQGENISCKGRIVIFEIITPPSSQQGVMGNPKYKFIHAKSEKGSVSAVSSVQGNIILSIGPKVLMYSFESEKELIGKAFFDAQIYIVSIKTFKNYIVVSDMYKSIVFLIWKRWSRQLIALSKDYNQLAVTDTDFIVFRNKLRVLVADQSKNLQFFHFDPKSVDSREGQMLLPTTDFHLGSQVTKFRHLRINENKDHENPGCASIFGTVDGSLGIIIPIEEEVYDRLLTLQSMMISGLPHFAGLNPKAFRKFKPMYKTLRPKCTTILDGELLMKYLSLEVGYQREFAKLIGTTPDHILNNLLSIELSSTFF